MFNFFKNILGIPSNSEPGSRNNNEHSESIRNDFWQDRDENNECNGSNDIGKISEGHVNAFGVPTFNDPFEIHKFVEHLIDKMFESNEFFKMPISSIFFSEESGDEMSPQSAIEAPKTSQSLRDSFLKSPDTHSVVLKKEDIDLDGQITADDVENYLHEGPHKSVRSFFSKFNFSTEDSNGDGDDDDDGDDNGGDDHGHVNQQGVFRDVNLFNQNSNFKFYSKSVYVESVVNPDGSVKIIKKIQDSNGNEETIIEDSHSSNNLNDQFIPLDDSTGFSILKKFFPFK